VQAPDGGRAVGLQIGDDDVTFLNSLRECRHTERALVRDEREGASDLSNGRVDEDARGGSGLRSKDEDREDERGGSQDREQWDAGTAE
jgi:hypothetical protein